MVSHSLRLVSSKNAVVRGFRSAVSARSRRELTATRVIEWDLRRKTNAEDDWFWHVPLALEKGKTEKGGEILAERTVEVPNAPGGESSRSCSLSSAGRRRQ